jgi:hypothetical protein
MNSWEKFDKTSFPPKGANLIILTLATQSMNMLRVYRRKQAVKLCMIFIIY